MILKVGQNEYNVRRAEQVVNPENVQFYIYLTDNLNIEELYQEIGPVIGTGFFLDEEEFTGYTLDSIRKEFDMETPISLYLSKKLN